MIYFVFQGRLTLARVLALLKQAITALLHLHSLGILHRDLRAANVLVDSLDPLQIRVADFGVSHLLSAFCGGAGAGRATDLTAGKVQTVLRGGAALGPLQVRICVYTLLSCLVRACVLAVFAFPVMCMSLVVVWLVGLLGRCCASR